MKVQILTPTIADIKYLKVDIEDYYLEDFEVNGKEVETWDDFPSCMKGRDGNIEFAVDIETGKILGWTEGTTFVAYAKIADGGTYFLTDENYERMIPSLNRYVPCMLDTRSDGYGDYMQFSVNEQGYIVNFKVNFNDFPVRLLS